MSAGHTPGPWAVDAQYLSEVQTADNKTIASCWHEYADGAEIQVSGVLRCSLEESAANARLIAAAPALFEALKPFAAMLDALELQSNGPKSGVWYGMESSVVGMREITVEDFKAARAALAAARPETVKGEGA